MDGLPPTEGGSLRAASSTAFDDRGRPYQSRTYSIDPNNGLAGSLSVAAVEALPALTQSMSYDSRGNLVKSVNPQGIATLTHYDGAGRGDSTEVVARNNLSLSSKEVTFDGNGNPIGTTTFDLQPDGNQRVSYTANYYDGADRLIATVDAGTNGGAPYARTSFPPFSSTDKLLVSRYTYDAGGWVQTSTDPGGIVQKRLNDALGRPLYTLDNYSLNHSNDNEYNRRTDYRYDGLDHRTQVTTTAYDDSGHPRTANTFYNYGVGIGADGGGSAVNSNDLLGSVQYPGFSQSTVTATVEHFNYNAAGERIEWKDRNQTDHTYAYDGLGRLTRESVSPSLSINGDVRTLSYGFDAAGRPSTFTSLNGNGAVVNQVQRTYNGFGQLTSESQEANGPVTGTSPTVRYGYSNAVSGSLLSSLTYPDGRVVTYNRDPQTTQVSSLSDSTPAATLESYQYLGVGAMISRTRPQEGVSVSVGLDNFGRVNDVNWAKGGASIDHFRYAYNFDSSAIDRTNLIDPTLSEHYAYDASNRQNSFQLGGGTPVTWKLDETGNKYGGTAYPTESTYNDFGGLGSASSDAATTVSMGGSQSAAVTYDAWNRAVKTVNNGNDSVNANRRYDYDALGRPIALRVTDASGVTQATTRYIYDANQNQVIEDLSGRGGSDTGQVLAQYVRSPDGLLILRDKGTGATFQRLYAQSDRDGSVTSIAAIDGTVVERYRYNQDGFPTVTSVVPATNYDWQYRYHGMRWQPMDWTLVEGGTGPGDTPTATLQTAGLYQNVNGMYDPYHGRALQPDPMAYLTGRNAYATDYQRSGAAAFDSAVIFAGGIILGVIATAVSGGAAAPILSGVIGGLVGGAAGSGFNAYAAGDSASGVATQAVIGGTVGAAIGGGIGLAGRAIGSLASRGASQLAVVGGEVGSGSASSAFASVGGDVGSGSASGSFAAVGGEVESALERVGQSTCFIAGTRIAVQRAELSTATNLGIVPEDTRVYRTAAVRRGFAVIAISGGLGLIARKRLRGCRRRHSAQSFQASNSMPMASSPQSCPYTLHADAVGRCTPAVLCRRANRFERVSPEW